MLSFRVAMMPSIAFFGEFEQRLSLCFDVVAKLIRAAAFEIRSSTLLLSRMVSAYGLRLVPEDIE